MIVIMLVVRLCIMVIECLFVACSCYEKMLLVCWNSSLATRTYGFKLNEVELPHEVATVITV